MIKELLIKCIKRFYWAIEEKIVYISHPKPKVKNVYETIRYIIDNKCSVSRIGDGEFGIIIMKKDIGFQKKNLERSKRLKEVLASKQDNLLVCITDIFNKKELKNRTKDNKRWWKVYLNQYRKQWYKYIDFNREYGATNFTRYYITRKDKSDCADYFNKVRKIWQDEDIVIIEGEKTRSGIGNDLYDNAKSVKRILAPAENAFDKYQKILEEANKIEPNKLILLALGPTATVLAYDLSRTGHRAIDVGHMDVEYEWFLHKATDRTNLENKYVNESNDNDFSDNFHDEKYESQIIKRIL